MTIRNLNLSILKTFIITGLFLSLFFTSTAYARDLPKYQVEVIVFEVGAIKGWTEEHWPLIENELNISGGIRAKSLAPSQFLLRDVAKKLTPQKGYRILSHQSWNIYGRSARQATTLKIENFPTSINQTKLLGTMTFHKSRFAHVRLNLQIERMIPNRVKAGFATHKKISAVELPQDWRFEINESRRIRAGELHYIDHPLFGAIVQIKRIT